MPSDQETEFIAEVRPDVCRQVRRLLSEYGLRVTSECNGDGPVCGHCIHTARIRYRATHRNMREEL